MYSVVGKNRINSTGEKTFGILYYADIAEFSTLPKSKMEKVVLFDELPWEWTYPLIQPNLIEKARESLAAQPRIT